MGKNNYGHPAAEIIRRYREHGCDIFRNDTDGAVGVDIKKDGTIKVVKMID